jgi:hypothetical protein
VRRIAHIYIKMNNSSKVRFVVFTALTMKNSVFWDVKTSSYPTGNISRLRYIAQPVNDM